MVPVVTAEHGRRFAETYVREPVDAWGASGIFIWPDDKASQLRVHELEDDIEERMQPEVQEAIAAAFVKAANEVLDAEREEATTPRFVKLKGHGTDAPLWINPDHVQAFYGQGSWTVIHLANGDLQTIEEGPEEVAARFVRCDARAMTN